MELSSIERLTSNNKDGYWVLNVRGNKKVDNVTLTSSGSSKNQIHPWNKQSSWNYSFESNNPKWSIESMNLLTITYRSRHEALPKYTNISKAYRYLDRLMFCKSKRCHKSIDWIHEVYTYEDIIEIMEEGLFIKGVGLCSSIQIMIQPKRFKENTNSNEYIIITFAIPKKGIKSKSPLLWKIKIPDDPSIAMENITILNGSLSTTNTIEPSHVFINGWQSWSFAGSVAKGMKQPKSAMPNVFSLAFNQGGTIPPLSRPLDINDKYDDIWNNENSNFYQSDFFTAITSQQSEYQSSIVLGWLSQTSQFGLITIHKYLTETISMHCSCDSKIIKQDEIHYTETDWAWCQIQLSSNIEKQEQTLIDYIDTVADHNSISIKPTSLPVGWCSWYHYKENITTQNLLQNFEKLGGTLKYDFDFNVVVVDDGYMTAWGDWDSLKPKSFPHKDKTTLVMKSISDAIRKNGMRPGIWLAPYACDKSSKVAKYHPDWIIKNEKGLYANSANCGKFFYGLDATNPAVRDHAFKAIRRAVDDWGFEVLKLDFLYAACLIGNGKYNHSLTRAQTMHLALTNVREAARPNTYLIGCGCPIGSGIQIMNSMRISADTGPTWYPEFPLPWWDNGTLPSLRGMLRNTIHRSIFGFKWWHNDPDCLMLGDTTHLTFHELISSASIVGMTSGLLLLSDDLEQVPKQNMEVAKKIYPVTGVTATCLDLHHSVNSFSNILYLWCSDHHNIPQCVNVAHNLGTWSIVSLSNWFNQPRVISTPLHHLLPNTKGVGYHMFAFWSSRYIWIPNTTNPNLSRKLQSHETEIFIIKAIVENHPQYIGSTFHFTCGFEVDSFRYNTNTVWIQLKNQWKRSGWIYLFLPGSNNVHAHIVSETDKSKKLVDLELVATLPHSDPNRKQLYMGRIMRLPISIQGQRDSQQTPNEFTEVSVYF